MRITQSMLISSTLNNIALNQQRLDELQTQITSGRKISQPSDDPIGVARALTINGDIRRLEQYKRNSLAGAGWLHGTETALQQVTTVLQRARELAISGGTDTMSPLQRGSIAAEVTQLFNTLLDLSNAKQGGRYLFAGHAVLTKPFAAAPTPAGYTYQGDIGQLEIELGPNTTVAINTPGPKVFASALTAVKTLETALAASNISGIQGAIDAIDSALDNNLGELAAIGAKTARVMSSADRSSDLNVDKQAELSSVMDMDMADALMHLNSRQAVYQASLKAASQAIQPSLLDYLK
jgi:flagellar hook-associated protein 3 FlgL